MRHPAIYYRPFQPTDRSQVFEVLEDLPLLYPGASEWLDERLDDVTRCRARADLGLIGERVVALTIETPKASGEIKLSTLRVVPVYRRRGIGRELLLRARRRWLSEGRSGAYLTAPEEHADALWPLLSSLGFVLQASAVGRYRTGRREFVFSWSPVAHHSLLGLRARSPRSVSQLACNWELRTAN